MREFIRRLAGPLDRATNKRPHDRRGQHRDGGEHPGLLLQRYLCESAAAGRHAPMDGSNAEEKRAILQAAINAAMKTEVRTLYRMAFERWSASLPSDPPAVDLVAAGRLVVGLGAENVLETGLRLHHTYGMPLIPGSALKGLAAHYGDRVWGPADNRFRAPTPAEDGAYRKFLRGKGSKPDDNFHRLLFGSTDDSGCIVFHDAWYTPDSSPRPLVMDVMTPHHPQWNDSKNPVSPTDFDSPAALPFLAVTGSFRVAVSWCGPPSEQARNWVELARNLLCDALKDWGVGGKTSSGYGKMADVQQARVPETSLRRTTAAKTNAAKPGAVSRGGSVKVKFLGAHDKLPNAFWVEEAGKKRGLLKYGVARAPLPEVNAEIEVYRTNDNPNSPEYRWDPPPRPDRPGAGPGGKRPRRER